MDAETTDSWKALDLKLPWSWCLVALLPVAMFFAASHARARHGAPPTSTRSAAPLSAPAFERGTGVVLSKSLSGSRP